jgi:ornithine decarboxylase
MPPTDANLFPFFDTLRILELDLVGVSFHVGSGCMSEKSYEDALYKTRYVFDFAKINYDMDLRIIDLGGGFMQNEPLLTAVSQVIKKNLENLFDWTPEKTDLLVMAEPGRFMATNVFDLYVRVIGKKTEWNGGRGKSTEDEIPTKIKYYVNNSVYGAFNCKVFDYAVFDYEIWRHSNRAPQQIPSVVFGGTCDSLDKIIDEAMLPEMDIGDHMCFKNMGAYTMSASCEFNGLPLGEVYDEETDDNA